MNLLEIKKIILEVAGEKLASKIDLDGIETKLQVCKEASEYLKYQIINTKKQTNFDDFKVDDISISALFANLLKEKAEKNELLIKKKYLEMISRIKTLCVTDAKNEFKRIPMSDKPIKENINKAELIEALTKIDENDLKRLELSKVEINLIEKIRIVFHNVKDELKAVDDICNYVEDKKNYLDTNDILLLKDICSKVVLVNPILLEEFGLGHILFDSYPLENLIVNSNVSVDSAIDLFLINNRNLILYNKEITDEVNKRVGFELIINNDELSKFYNSYLISSEREAFKYKTGIMDLNVLLNKINLISRVYALFGIKSLNRLQNIDNEIYKEYYKRLAFKAANLQTLDKIFPENVFNDLINKNRDTFSMLFSYCELVGNGNINETPNKNSKILNEILDMNGLFSELTEKEIATIIIDYFVFFNKEKILSEDEALVFKDLSPLINDIISNRGNAEDIISNYTNSDYVFKEKENNKENKL